VDEINLIIDRLILTGLPESERETFAARLKTELRRALTERFADTRERSDPSPDALRDLVLDVARQLASSSRLARKERGQ
jgi:tRNA uridine 5-carbamoylmethylation protein Kti12